MTNDMENSAPPAPLADVARLGLSAGRILLESGANGRIVHEAVADIAAGLRCDSAEVICQHAAVLVMIRRGGDHCMQMGKAGEHGVNLRRAQAVRRIIRRVHNRELACAPAQAEMDRIPATVAKYPVWFVCLSTGLACGAFGRLIACSAFDKLHGRDWSADWAFFLPTVAGAAIGQFTRHTLFHRGHNIFLTAGVVSFVSAFLAGIGARLVGSASASLAMVAAVLLLVPGVAVLNAQVDVLESKPNLAAARALRVLYLLLFMALGLALAQGIVLRRP
jgi:uncharacterized membrane protein YjjP (DUF1212 family)